MAGMFKHLTRSSYGLIAGVLAAGAAAAAAGAAPSSLNPWSDEPARTDVPTTTVAVEPSSSVVVTTPAAPSGHEPETTSATAVEPTEPATTTPAPTDPATTQPAITEPATTMPATTVPAPTEHHDPATTTPAATAPSEVETSTPATEPPAAEPTTPATAEPAATSPPSTAPATTTAPKPDNSVQLGLSMSCNASSNSGVTDVACNWSGPTPAGFAKFVLLRGNGGATGRVPFMSTDPSSSSFVDSALAPGSYTYVLVALDSASKPLVHSNMVPITVGG